MAASSTVAAVGASVSGLGGGVASGGEKIFSSSLTAGGVSVSGGASATGGRDCAAAFTVNDASYFVGSPTTAVSPRDVTSMLSLFYFSHESRSSLLLKAARFNPPSPSVTVTPSGNV